MLAIPETAELIEHGVDWLTVTAREPHLIKALVDEGDRILSDARSQGDEVRPFNWKGFTGWCAGGVDVGVRYDCGMVRVHGRTAQLEWSNVGPLGQNWTRIDLQHTYKLKDCDVDAFICKAWRSVKHTKLHGKNVLWHYERDIKDGDTLEIGRRSSEKFGRAYNKAKESKLDHYEACIRAEGEFKGDCAKTIAMAMLRSKVPANVASGYLCQFLSERGIKLRTLPGGSLQLIGCTKSADVDRYLSWLRKSLQSGVRNAVELRGVEAVIEALGLTDHVQPKHGPFGPTDRSRRISKNGSTV